MPGLRFDKKKIAIMQGRLVDSERKGELQFFPKKQWKKELTLFKKNNFRFIEWVASSHNLGLACARGWIAAFGLSPADSAFS